jgi:tRNA uridine 5-carboxymethylaminomethyl modification enzyme
VGFENVKFFRPGYAIEYDYFPPTQLKHTLEVSKDCILQVKLMEQLVTKKQLRINGWYKCTQSAREGTFNFKRDEAYIGVLIDDLITKGTEEPYRMFTSRDIEHYVKTMLILD